MHDLCVVLLAAVPTSGLAVYTVTVDFEEVTWILYTFSCPIYCSYMLTIIIYLFINE